MMSIYRSFIAGSTLLAVLTLATAGVLAGSGASVSDRPDGGKSVTRSGVRGSECSVFSKSGDLVCRRTFNIVNHQQAIAKCVAVRCSRR